MTEPPRPSVEALERLNALPEAEARSALQRCCGAERWVSAMLQHRPFANPGALLTRAAAVWGKLGRDDYLEAFSHHPEIGQNLDELRRKFAATADWSQAEQAGTTTASEEVLLALRSQNRAYRERFGYSFIVCATGKSATEMLSLLEQRIDNPPELELSLAAAEQAKITRLRLEKLSP